MTVLPVKSSLMPTKFLISPFEDVPSYEANLTKETSQFPANSLIKSAANKKQPFKIPTKIGISFFGKSAFTLFAKCVTIAAILSLLI